MTANNQNLTAERVRFLFDYNPTTGDLRWRNPTAHRLAVGDKVGALGANGRIYVGIDGERHLAHRVIWLYVHGHLPEENLAARNSDYTDLRLDNYFLQSFSETARKNPIRSSNTSGIRGVIWDKDKGKWRAEITRDYQKIQVGRFDTKEEAEAAYLKASQAETRPSDPEERRQQAARKLVDSQIRRLWKRIIKANGGSVDWSSFEQFANEVRPNILPRMTLVSTNAARKIGPGNYRWVAIEETTLAGLSPEAKNVRDRYRRSHNPDVYKDKELRRAFGITLERYRAMLLEQNGACAICKKPEVEVRRGKIPALAVDHCHSTGAVRGLLCIACNTAIARFKDNPALMRAGADYVERYAAEHAQTSTSVPASNVIPLKLKER